MENAQQRKVFEAMEHAQMIKELIENIAKLKDRALISSLGFDVTEDEDETTSSSSDDDDDNDQFDKSVDECDILDEGVLQEKVNEYNLLKLLKENECNWYQFVMVLRDKMNGMTIENFNQVLHDFGDKLPSLELSQHEKMITEQSRQAYIAANKVQKREKAAEESIIVSSDSGDSEAELLATEGVPDCLIGNVVTEILRKRRAAIQRKAVRSKAKIAAQRFLRRHKSKRVSKIISECEGIEGAVEEYVRSCGVGANAWRRTGVLTFDGNRKVKKKATFKGIKEYLERKYMQNFSYGSVVQLCIARNKRRKSASRYKGVACIISRRARKGFNLRYNPDSHWSSALYSGLNMIQLQDGYNIMNLGRDDQAGFRLDTMSTHRLHKTLSVKGNAPLTTRTDYVTKYPSTLQTSSYNFPETESTGEICAGIVKVIPVHAKNPPQHFADLKMLHKKDAIKPAFYNRNTGLPKTIECIQVDGGGDEGPAHVEVQYWWTVRHIEQATQVTMVTSRNSGASYRNRVELQNGCLALVHANVFIPSTLNGNCVDGSGETNMNILENNLNSAIDVYIDRVDGAPCASTGVHLYKGPKSDTYQKENEHFKVFIKGNKAAKEKLKKTPPELFAKFERVWGIRKMHLETTYPLKYIFLLRCCYKDGCDHPVCLKGRPIEESTWYPNGPPVSYIPIPTPDPNRPFGGENCNEYKECSGHLHEARRTLGICLQRRKNVISETSIPHHPEYFSAV